MPSSQRLRFDGRIYVQQSTDLAVEVADSAWAMEPAAQHLSFNLFCDCSTARDRGRISVTYQPLARSDPMWDIVGLAWPVNPIYDNDLGELLAVSESLAIATHEIADFHDWPNVKGKTIVVRIFNDSKFNIKYLEGSKGLDWGMLTLAKPVFDLIAMQSRAIKGMGVPVELELHWIPGHHHDVFPHQWADELAREARQRSRSFSSKTGDNWSQKEEPCVVRYLAEDLFEAACKAVRYMPELRTFIRWINRCRRAVELAQPKPSDQDVEPPANKQDDKTEDLPITTEESTEVQSISSIAGQPRPAKNDFATAPTTPKPETSSCYDHEHDGCEAWATPATVLSNITGTKSDADSNHLCEGGSREIATETKRHHHQTNY